ncbi:hypothetical protein T484DRAFT_1780548 [Baffinella frigidus]|nr:hypothetical protein T484DRAFT_1780548 [Cryptophyta sp. CCMP2293]
MIDFDGKSNRKIRGGVSDASTAFELYESAARQGNADAQFAVGMLYRDGEGVDESLDKSLEVEEGVEQSLEKSFVARPNTHHAGLEGGGHVEAQYVASTLMFSEPPATRDPQAMVLLEKAAAAGDQVR